MKVNKVTMDIWKRRWEGSEECMGAKFFSPYVSSKKTKELLGFNKNDMKVSIEILTAQFPLGKMPKNNRHYVHQLIQMLS